MKRRYLILCLLVTCGCESWMPAHCVETKDDHADKRAAFILECIGNWNPGEEEWGAGIGRKCENLSRRLWPRQCLRREKRD